MTHQRDRGSRALVPSARAPGAVVGVRFVPLAKAIGQPTLIPLGGSITITIAAALVTGLPTG